MMDNLLTSPPFEVRLDLPAETYDLDFARVVSKDYQGVLL